MNVQKKLTVGLIRTKLNLLTIVDKKKAGEEAFKLFCTPFSSAGPECDIFKNGEPLQFKLDGRNVRGYRCNHPQPHKILILHGFSSSCHNFQKYAEHFIEKGYEVIAFDAPAHGASEGNTVNAFEYRAMIKKAVEMFGPFQGYLAHSFGGLALTLALEEMPHDANTKIVLIAPATETTTAIDNAMSFLGLKNPVLRKAVDDKIFTVSGKKTSWFSIRRAIQNIRASVLWIHDEDDSITPLQDALKVKEDAPGNVQFLITKGLGHSRIYRDDEVIKAVMKFL